MTIKTKDFIEIEYTGKLEGGTVFDTTDGKVAKENEIYNEGMNYGPVIMCVGEKQILAGLDNALEGKEADKEYTIHLKAEQAFGKKNVKLIQLIQTSKFLKQKIQPVPGLQINIDGVMGLVKTVSGGRTLVDFNHPLSGKDLIYVIKIKRVIQDDKEKLEGYLKLRLGVKDISVRIENGEATAQVKNEIASEDKEAIMGKVKELIPGIKKMDIIK